MQRDTALQKPELSSHFKQWLGLGGNFPSELAVEFADDAGLQQVKYDILDRDQEGRIPALLQRSGHKGFVLKVRDQRTRRILAAKLCLTADYDQHKLKDELELASTIAPEAPIAVYEALGWVQPFPEEPAPKGKWLCFLGPWIDGETLAQLVTTRPHSLSPDLAIQVLLTLLEAVLYLEAKGVKHDDLHLGNIMLRRLDAALRIANPDRADIDIRVVDIGSLKRREQPTSKPHDDWSSYAECVVKLHNVLHSNRLFGSRYYRALRILKDFAKALSDEDHGRHFPQTEHYYNYLKNAKL